MKRGNHLGNGTYQYSNGMIGTKDLPEFVATLAYREHHTSKRQNAAYTNLSCHVKPELTIREQLANVH